MSSRMPDGLFDDFICHGTLCRDGIGGNHELPPPEEPTDAVAGSPEKLDVLIARHAMRQGLWHEDDYVDPERIGYTMSRLLPRDHAGGGYKVPGPEHGVDFDCGLSA
jgi:hypothetical protein